jgi:hypothetical protein
VDEATGEWSVSAHFTYLEEADHGLQSSYEAEIQPCLSVLAPRVRTIGIVHISIARANRIGKDTWTQEYKLQGISSDA